MSFGCLHRKGSVPARRFFIMSLLVLVCLPVLVSCQAKNEKEGKDMASANISPYNHTGDYIHQLYVNGQWGGNSYAYGGGGSFVCCVVYPRKWRPDLTATVKWTTSSSDPNGSPDQAWHEKVVPIDEYVKTGTTLNVHFLPGNDVKLVITDKSASHPDYLGPPPPEVPPDWPPWEHDSEPVDVMIH